MPMNEAAGTPSLFLDFDDTITCGDVLDRVIERFSPEDDWRDAEAQWQAGRITTRECLSRQIAGLRVSSDALVQFSAQVRVDPAFHDLIDWARERHVSVIVLSDNFMPVITAILAANDVRGLAVRANDLVFDGDRVSARFPWTDSACDRCAHCKAQHVRHAAHRPAIFVGDGPSDICPAQAADLVFAKNALAKELERRGVAYQAFKRLGDVNRSLRVMMPAASMR
jgi:2,3-diketo-5-methylthio-1-phosphopentane phosphatase